MADSFVVVYYVPSAPVALRYLYLFGKDSSQSGPLPTQAPANPHFIGRFTAPTFARAIQSQDTSRSAVPAETGLFHVVYDVPPAPVATRYLYYQNRAADPFVQPAANVHFI